MGAHQRVPDHTAGSDTNQNLEIMAQMWQCHLLKPETNKGDLRLYFELFEKSYRGHHQSEKFKNKYRHSSGKPRYRRSILVLKPQNGEYESSRSTFLLIF